MVLCDAVDYALSFPRRHITTASFHKRIAVYGVAVVHSRSLYHTQPYVPYRFELVLLGQQEGAYNPVRGAELSGSLWHHILNVLAGFVGRNPARPQVCPLTRPLGSLLRKGCRFVATVSLTK